MKSPFMENVEDEHFIKETILKVKHIIDGDENLAHLFQLLVCFSPVDLDLGDKNIRIMKEFQDKVSIMIYTYLLKRSSNLESLEKMTKLVSLVDDVHKMGKLFSVRHLQTTEVVELDAIEVDSF